MKSKLNTSILRIIILFFAINTLYSCTHYIATPESDKIASFHKSFDYDNISSLKSDELSLYVDYSTCISQGQFSDFYNKLVPSFVDATKKYFSIKGDIIQQEDGDVFTLLRSIKDTNYSELKKAIDLMSESDSESVLLTDGEYYKPDVTKSSINNPYMADAFKKWLSKGHDIYILSEPYIESYKGKTFNKKRMYILFTDSRLLGNIWERIKKTTILEDFPDVSIYHLSADHPALLLPKGCKTSCSNPSTSAKVTEGNGYELHEWTASWQFVEDYIISAKDSLTGEVLPFGDYISKGLILDRNSLGGYRITSLKAKSYIINQEYADFYNGNTFSVDSIQVFDGIIIDKEEFEKHGQIVLHFDPSFERQLLNGDPYNYIKIDLYVDEVEDISFDYTTMLGFDSIEIPGQINSSIVESIKHSLFTPEIKNLISNKPVYTYYLKTYKYKF